MAEKVTITLSLSPEELRAVETALRGVETGLGALSLKLIDDYDPEVSEWLAVHSEASERVLSRLQDELREASNGQTVAEKAGVKL